MGTSIDKDLLRSSVIDEHLEDLRYPRVLHTRIQFPIGIGPRSTFSKQQMALRIELPALDESVPPLRSLDHLRAALQDARLRSSLDQSPGAEEPRRTCSHHNRTPIGLILGNLDHLRFPHPGSILIDKLLCEM
jgi:hypothetical protein